MTRPAAAPRTSWIDRLRGAEVVFLVDPTGEIRPMTPEKYAGLPLDELRGSSVFLSRREAERCAVTRKKS